MAKELRNQNNTFPLKAKDNFQAARMDTLSKIANRISKGEVKKTDTHPKWDEHTISPFIGKEYCEKKLKKSPSSIEEARKMNESFLMEKKKEINRKYEDKWIVIANGELAKVDDSFEEVKDVALEESHRFVFKVEGYQKGKGSIRWPMKEKV